MYSDVQWFLDVCTLQSGPSSLYVYVEAKIIQVIFLLNTFHSADVILFIYAFFIEGNKLQ